MMFDQVTTDILGLAWHLFQKAQGFARSDRGAGAMVFWGENHTLMIASAHEIARDKDHLGQILQHLVANHGWVMHVSEAWAYGGLGQSTDPGMIEKACAEGVEFIPGRREIISLALHYPSVTVIFEAEIRHDQGKKTLGSPTIMAFPHSHMEGRLIPNVPMN